MAVGRNICRVHRILMGHGIKAGKSVQRNGASRVLITNNLEKTGGKPKT